ncbi:hypothetical protein BDM02DRAFT_2505746 [Thelephora ganbajun]|uniref:Uncharacterized protein n=1 Tax=Thelephora ganbajun TaxID=370292 RepID=A0ACB6ZE89_THEGA|nr:hypothetical protein BDM02DRAFT_2505746 [Thelephora ganbajun]
MRYGSRLMLVGVMALNSDLPHSWCNNLCKHSVERDYLNPRNHRNELMTQHSREYVNHIIAPRREQHIQVRSTKESSNGGWGAHASPVTVVEIRIDYGRDC